MAIINQLKWRYATKSFNSEKVLSELQLDTIKQAFNLTATSYGLQTLKMVVIKDKKRRQDLVPIAFGQKQVVEASHLLVLCIQTNIDENDVTTHFDNIQKTRNTPSEVLSSFKNQLTETINSMPNSKKEAWAKNQAYIALGNLMTVCAVEEIDSCPMEGFNPDALDVALGLNDLGLKSVLLLPVGFRSESDFFSSLEKVRKPVSETIIEI